MTVDPLAFTALVILTLLAVVTVWLQADKIRQYRHILARHIERNELREQCANTAGHWCGCGRPSNCQPAREAL